MSQSLIMAINNKSLGVIILKCFQAVKQSPEQVRVDQGGLAACFIWSGGKSCSQAAFTD